MMNVIVIFRSDCESNDVVESKEIMLMMLKRCQCNDIQSMIVKAMMLNVIVIFRADCESNDVECNNFNAMIVNR